MEDQIIPMETLLARSEKFARTGVELIRLKTIAKSADLLGDIVAGAIAGGVLLICLLFLSTGLALWTGSLLGNTWLGFILVGSFYALCGIVLLVSRKRWIKVAVRNRFIAQALN